MLINDYLSSPLIKDDPWVKDICSAKTAEEVADLLMKRITESNIYGPGISHASRQAIEDELPVEIYYTLVSEAVADLDLAEEAITLIMNRVQKKEIPSKDDVMENIFYLIEHFTVESTATDLFQWVKDNLQIMKAEPLQTKAIFLNAINALAYAQKEDTEGIGEFWMSLWNQKNPFWWNSAFLGIRYYDLDQAISLIPDLVERKCSNTNFLMMTIWRIQDDKRMPNFLKKGFRDNQPWAGLIVNGLASKMKWAEKKKLVDRLHDDELELIEETNWLGPRLSLVN